MFLKSIYLPPKLSILIKLPALMLSSFLLPISNGQVSNRGDFKYFNFLKIRTYLIFHTIYITSCLRTYIITHVKHCAFTVRCQFFVIVNQRMNVVNHPDAITLIKAFSGGPLFLWNNVVL